MAFVGWTVKLVSRGACACSAEAGAAGPRVGRRPGRAGRSVQERRRRVQGRDNGAVSGGPHHPDHESVDHHDRRVHHDHHRAGVLLAESAASQPRRVARAVVPVGRGADHAAGLGAASTTAAAHHLHHAASVELLLSSPVLYTPRNYTVCTVVCFCDNLSLNRCVAKVCCLPCLQCFDTVGWASGTPSGLQKLSDVVFMWLSVWSKVQIQLMPQLPKAPSSLASFKSTLVLP